MLNRMVLAGASLLLTPMLIPASVGQIQRPDTTSAGLEAPWDVQQILTALRTQLDKLQPLLARMNPQSWVDKQGAPTTYIVQYQSLQQQLKDVVSITGPFGRTPENLSLGLDLYFRLEGLETTLRSLEEGARQFDSRSISDQIGVQLGASFVGRQKFREYLRDLALTTEQNFRVADSEAQRCRATLGSNPASAKSKKH